MTSIEVGAMLASAILLKGTVVAISLLIAARLARSASGAALYLGIGHGALGMMVLISPLLPQLNSGGISISHRAVQPFLLLVLIWASGVLVMLARLVCDIRAATVLTRRASRLTGGRVSELLLRAGSAVHVARLPDIRETRELSTVALIGFRRPVLLIPAAAQEWSDEELFGVLCHELEHLRRNDWLMLMVERIVTTVFWINPLIHVMGRYAASAREVTADDAALRAGAAAQAYAARLIAVARELHNAPRMAVSVAFAGGGRVDKRVRALFDNRDRQPTARFSMLQAVVVVMPLVLALAAFEPWTCLP